MALGHRNKGSAKKPLAWLFDREPRRIGEIPMNWDQIEGNWKQLKGKVQAKWGDLTDDEYDQIAGNREQLEGRIQEKYGKTKEEAKQEVDDFLSES